MRCWFFIFFSFSYLVSLFLIHFAPTNQVPLPTVRYWWRLRSCFFSRFFNFLFFLVVSNSVFWMQINGAEIIDASSVILTRGFKLLWYRTHLRGVANSHHSRVTVRAKISQVQWHPSAAADSIAIVMKATMITLGYKNAFYFSPAREQQICLTDKQLFWIV